MRCLSRGQTWRWLPLGWEGRETCPHSFVPHWNMGWQVYCFVPSLNGWQLPPFRTCQEKFAMCRERFVRMTEGLCPGCLAEWRKYGLFKIMTTVSISNTACQCVLTPLMWFDVWIFQNKLFKCSFTALNKVDTAECNRTRLNWLWTGGERVKDETCSKHGRPSYPVWSHLPTNYTAYYPWALDRGPKSGWIMGAQPLPVTQKHFQAVWQPGRT